MNVSVKLAIVSSLFFITGMSYLVEQVARPVVAQAPLRPASLAAEHRGVTAPFSDERFVDAPPTRVMEVSFREPIVVMASERNVDLPPLVGATPLPPVQSVSEYDTQYADAAWDAPETAARGDTLARAAVLDEPLGDRLADASPVAQYLSYTVRPGDSLRKIARLSLKDESRWTEIQQLNNLKDADRIVAGMSLRLPLGDS